MTAAFSPRGTLGILSGALCGAMGAFAFGFAVIPSPDQSVLAAHLALGLFLFSSVPLFASGLGAGIVSAVIAVITGVMGLLIYGQPAAATYFLIGNGIPALALSALALRARAGNDQKLYWYPEGFLTTAMAMYPALLFVIKLALSWNEDGGLLGETARIMNEALTMLLTATGAEAGRTFTQDEIDMIVTQTTRILPALAGSTWFLITFISVIFAQMTLKQQGWNLRPQFTLDGFVLPPWLLVGVAGTGLAAYMAPDPYAYIGGNLCALMCIPFFFEGLAVVHAFATNKKGRKAILALFYTVLCVLPWLAVLVTLIGTLDQGLNLQRRLKSQPKQI